MVQSISRNIHIIYGVRHSELKRTWMHRQSLKVRALPLSGMSQKRFPFSKHPELAGWLHVLSNAETFVKRR
jgi:hypothetical protein